MDYEKLKEQIHIYLTISLAFFIPCFPPVLSPLIGLLMLNWVLSPKKILPGIRIVLKNYALSLLVLLYIFYLIGMVYTNNIKFGLEVIETKLSFLLLPLIYSSYYKVTKDNIHMYLKGFVFGCLLYAFVCFGWATYSFFKPVYTDLYGVMYDLGTDYFYYTYLSVFFHPSYASLYAGTALIFIIYLAESGLIKLNSLWIMAVSILVVFVLLLSSKAGWICLLLIALFSLAKLIKSRKIVLAFFISVFLTGLFFWLNISHVSTISKRIPQWGDIKKVITEKDKENIKVTTSADGSGTRVLLWKASMEIIQENFLLGVGTGDTKDAMLAKYKEKEMFNELKFGLNAHNQYLNTGVALGVFAFILLIMSLAFPFYYSVKRNLFHVCIFIIIVGVNWLFESMLESHAGVIFYTFFASLLYSQINYETGEVTTSY